MSRLASLSRHPRRTLATLATVLAAVGVTVASGADFTASAANPANVFSTGTLSVTDSQSSAILTAANMRPGDAASEGTVDIANTGSLSGTFALNVATPVDTDTVHPLSQQLNVTIDDCGTFTGGTAPACGDADDVNKYTGSLSQMGQPGHAVSSLGTFAGGVKHRYRFRVALDSGAGNVYQGAGSTATFTWNAA